MNRKNRWVSIYIGDLVSDQKSMIFELEKFEELSPFISKITK